MSNSSTMAEFQHLALVIEDVAGTGQTPATSSEWLLESEGNVTPHSLFMIESAVSKMGVIVSFNVFPSVWRDVHV